MSTPGSGPRLPDRSGAAPPHAMRDCTGCGLRFPAPVGHPAAGSCPRCGSATVTSDAVANPPPARSDRRSGRRSGSGSGPDGPRVAGLLDNVRSVLNVGAMFRTADAAGLVHLHLCGITAAGDHEGIDKTALGAQRTVDWTSHLRAPDAVDALRGAGWEVWALESRPGAEPLGDVVAWSGSGGPERGPSDHPAPPPVPVPPVPVPPVVVVVGHEVVGIDPAVLARADRVVAIPMHGAKRSLNVATAFGIAAYAARGAGRRET